MGSSTRYAKSSARGPPATGTAESAALTTACAVSPTDLFRRLSVCISAPVAVAFQGSREPIITGGVFQLHPLVPPQVSHFRQVPFRTRVKFPHSRQLSPS